MFIELSKTTFLYAPFIAGSQKLIKTKQFNLQENQIYKCSSKE